MRTPSPRILFYLFTALLAACSHAPPAAPVVPTRAYGSPALLKELDALLTRPYSDTQTVDVYYATSRAPLGDLSECGDAAFGIEHSKETSFGVCGINVPKHHKVGGFELADGPRADPHRYYRAVSQTSFDEKGLLEALRAAPPGDVLVFVHGFNVKFQEAVFRAAQIAYDLKFQGPVLLFSWPAGSGDGALEGRMVNITYQNNRANAAKSQPQAAAFFRLLAESGRKAHVVVHSMGHQVVLPALAQAAPALTGRGVVGELILNAPDFPVQDFKRLSPRFKPLADRVTVYCSYNDNAIAASESYNKGRRMGACEREPGVDVVNVGEIDAPALGVGGLGHGYYASRPILTDILQTLFGIAAEKRLFIRRSEPNTPEDFYLRP
ncbi:MAG: alpha/beta hydrolase [Elusimicrobiota bacterium]|jgi:esterase/lipase superfamily enzyme